MRRVVGFAGAVNGVILALLIVCVALRPAQASNRLSNFARYMPGQDLPNCPWRIQLPDSELCTLQTERANLFLTAREGHITVATLHTGLPAGEILAGLGQPIVRRDKDFMTFCYDHAKAILQNGVHWHNRLIYVSFTEDVQVC